MKQKTCSVIDKFSNLFGVKFREKNKITSKKLLKIVLIYLIANVYTL